MTQQAQVPTTADQATILVVEDDPDIRRVVYDIMQSAGHAVLTVDTGKAALELLEHEPVDLVLLDLMLPDMSGYDLCDQLRSDGNARLPIIMLTALTQPHNITRGLQAGADDYVKKPFMPDELVLRANNLLRRHQNAQDLSQEVSSLHSMLGLVQRQLTTAQDQTEVEATLRREFLHNVTTHLQAMCGIVESELRKLSPSPERESVQRIRSRLRGAALVYQISESLQSDPVAIGSVVRTIASALKAMYRPWKRIMVSVQGEPLDLPLSHAAPLAMIINELVTNCFKHAFPENRFGTVEISYQYAAPHVLLSVVDNGVGFDAQQTAFGRGRATVTQLAQSLGGRADWQSSADGTRVDVSIVLPPSDLA